MRVCTRHPSPGVHPAAGIWGTEQPPGALSPSPWPGALSWSSGSCWHGGAECLSGSIPPPQPQQECREGSGTNVVAATALPLVSTSSVPHEGGQWHATEDRSEAALPSLHPVGVSVSKSPPILTPKEWELSPLPMALKSWRVQGLQPLCFSPSWGQEEF